MCQSKLPPPLALWQTAAMKSVLLALMMSLLLARAEENKVSAPSEHIVLKLEQRWEDALIKADASALDELFDEGLVYTHSNGKVDTKQSYIRAIKSGATRYESMKRDDIRITVYDKAAVVTCHWEVHVASGGNKSDLDARYLHVYVNEGSGWKLVAHESTKIVK